MCNCKRCGTKITNPDYKVELWTDEHPEIIIGPYCESCFSKIRICSKCNKPHEFNDGTVIEGKRVCKNCCVSCEDCGSLSGATYEIDGKKLCKNCYNNYVVCGVCNKYHKKDDCVGKNTLLGASRIGIFRKYGPNVCKDCFDIKKIYFKKHVVVQCKVCSNICISSKIEEGYCKSCFDKTRICSSCGKRVTSFKTQLTCGVSEYNFFCSNCYNSKQNKCDICKRIISKESGFVNFKKLFSIVKVGKYHLTDNLSVCKVCNKIKEVSDKGLCSSCSNRQLNCTECGRRLDSEGRCRVCDNRRIYNYSWKEKLNFLFSKNEKPYGNIFFGFENEISFGSTSRGEEEREFMVKEIYKDYGPDILTLKSDGSIGGYGFEIVTQPMTLNFFKSFDFSKVFHVGFKKNMNCGLHIHVNREAFISDIHLYKVITFINHKDNKEFIRSVAGRGDVTYSKSFEKKISSSIKESKHRNLERYLNVNLCNKSTVEFRLFNGCTTYFELKHRVEFTHALITFCKDKSMDNIKKETFLSFLEDNRKVYPEIYSFTKAV